MHCQHNIKKWSISLFWCDIWKYPNPLLFNFFSYKLLSQYKKITCTTLNMKLTCTTIYCLLSGYWSSRLIHWLAGFRYSNLPTRKKTTLWISHISQCCLSNSMRKMTGMCLWLHMKNETVFLVKTVYKCFSLHFNTFKTMLTLQLTFEHFNNWNNNS